MPVDEHEEQDGDCFLGKCAIYSFPNGRKVKLIYKQNQLDGNIFPDLGTALDGRGFEKVDFWDLLTTVAVGGTFSLKGPRFLNPRSYDLKTLKSAFMARERNLVDALMVIVFSKEGNVAYGSSPISFKVVNGGFKFDTAIAYRKTTIYYRAENQSEDDVFRVTIEGTGHDHSMHQFKFEPSIKWLFNRYPDMKSASIGGALASAIPPQLAPVAVVGGEPVAEACNCGDDGGGNPSPSAARKKLKVHDRKMEIYKFVSNFCGFYSCVVTEQKSRPYQKSRGSRT
jgi:hypothetical protein